MSHVRLFGKTCDITFVEVMRGLYNPIHPVHSLIITGSL